MSLPESFAFSQSSLQDYVDCPRRFQLRYVLMQPWPPLVMDPAGAAERLMQRGAELHRLAQQHALGLDPTRLGASIEDPVVAGWWSTFCNQPPPDLPTAVRRPEVVLTAPLAGRRLVAKMDLLAVQPGERLVVVDWKTVPRPPDRATLARRLQTRVYRYLAVEAGAHLNDGRRPEPEHVEMLYWFADVGGKVERFPYDTGQYGADQSFLVDLAGQVVAHHEPVWPLTPNEKLCHTCNYRTLCERGVRPAFVEDLDDDLEPPEPEVDLEQIAEIEF